MQTQQNSMKYIYYKTTIILKWNKASVTALHAIPRWQNNTIKTVGSTQAST